jgi:cellulose synthase (UDP-forming)
MIASASAEERQALQYGIYDPEERFAKSDQIAVEHIFVHWEPSNVGRLRSSSDYAASRNRWLMVTVEPWPAHSRPGETLLTDITDGIYDSDLANIGSVLSVPSLTHRGLLQR